MDKTDVLRLVKQELDFKVIVASSANDPQLNAICDKIKRIQREADATIMQRSLFGKDDQNRPHFTTEQLEKLHENLNDDTNTYSKTRVLTKVLFKAEVDITSQKDASLKALNDYKDGAFDLAVKYACYVQYLKANGEMNWAKLEKDIDNEVKRRIENYAYDQGREDAENEMAE